VLPFVLTLLSATLAVFKRVLAMRYTLKQGYIRKMKLFVREKIKILDEAEINLSKLDRNGNLQPRRVLKNAHIVKRHRAIHEAAARKKVTARSQLSAKAKAGPAGLLASTEEDLLIPYKKVSYLPAYFYKVFIKKKKPAPEKERPNARKSIADARNAKKLQEEQQQLEKQGVIDLKTKKLREQMQQDHDDYQQESKIKVEKLHKTITKATRFGKILNRNNA
jgi:hypothetical protein